MSSARKAAEEGKELMSLDVPGMEKLVGEAGGNTGWRERQIKSRSCAVGRRGTPEDMTVWS